MTRRFGLLAAFAFSGLFWLVLLLSSCEQAKGRGVINPRLDTKVMRRLA